MSATEEQWDKCGNCGHRRGDHVSRTHGCLYEYPRGNHPRAGYICTWRGNHPRAGYICTCIAFVPAVKS